MPPSRVVCRTEGLCDVTSSHTSIRQNYKRNKDNNKKKKLQGSASRDFRRKRLTSGSSVPTEADVSTVTTDLSTFTADGTTVTTDGMTATTDGTTVIGDGSSAVTVEGSTTACVILSPLSSSPSVTSKIPANDITSIAYEDVMSCFPSAKRATNMFEQSSDNLDAIFHHRRSHLTLDVSKSIHIGSQNVAPITSVATVEQAHSSLHKRSFCSLKYPPPKASIEHRSLFHPQENNLDHYSKSPDSSDSDPDNQNVSKKYNMGIRKGKLRKKTGKRYMRENITPYQKDHYKLHSPILEQNRLTSCCRSIEKESDVESTKLSNEKQAQISNIFLRDVRTSPSTYIDINEGSMRDRTNKHETQLQLRNSSLSVTESIPSQLTPSETFVHSAQSLGINPTNSSTIPKIIDKLPLTLPPNSTGCNNISISSNMPTTEPSKERSMEKRSNKFAKEILIMNPLHARRELSIRENLSSDDHKGLYYFSKL